MNLFKRPKYLLMILLASITFAAVVPQFGNPLAGNTSSVALAADSSVIDKVTDWLAETLGRVVYLVTIKLPSLILLHEIKMFRVVGPYNGFTSQVQVVNAWKTVRDLANMFFILILLLMSFGTILQIQGYGYRQLLSRLLIMAILINFSKSIVAMLIDFSQIVTLTFLAPVIETIGGSVVVAMGLQHIMNMADKPKGDDTAYTGVAFLMAMLLGGIMMIITTVIMGVILAMFVARIIAFWILIILAPMAFLAHTFPQTDNYYKQWETELSKNLSLGPGLAFFIWLAFSIVGQGNISNDFGPANGDLSNVNIDGVRVDDTATFNTAVSKVAQTGNMLNFVIAISLLMAGLKFASASGAAGASVARSASTKLEITGSRLARGATIGAAAGVAGGAARLAWQGTSGEGGMKGIAGQTRGLVGRGLVQTGEAWGIGGVQRLGMRQVARENARRQRKEKYVDKGTEGMTPEQKEAYYESFGTRRMMPGSREGQNLLHKNRLRRGLAFTDLEKENMSDADALRIYNRARAADVTQEEVNAAKARRAQEMQNSFTRSGDVESTQLLRARSGVAHNADSTREQISEKGHKSFASTHFAGSSDATLGALLELTEKELSEIADAMNEQRRNELMSELERYKEQILARTPGRIVDTGDRNTDIGKISLLQGKFANGSTGMTNRAATTDGHGNVIAARNNSITQVYERLATSTVPAEQAAARNYMNNLLQSSSGSQIARIDRDLMHANTRLYDDATGQASDTQHADVMRAQRTLTAPDAPRTFGGTPISRTQLIAENRVANGNIESTMNDKRTARFVTNPQAQQYIDAQRLAGVSNKDIALAVPSFAHLVFGRPGDPAADAAFAAHIVTLSKTQLGNLNPQQLYRMKTHPDPAISAIITPKLPLIDTIV